jgi:hypothetical protein
MGFYPVREMSGMDEQQFEKIISILEEMRDDQKLQLQRQVESMERQAEMNALQKERLAGLDKQGLASLHDRAERIQKKSERMVGRASLIVYLLIPFLLILLALMLLHPFGR